MRIAEIDKNTIINMLQSYKEDFEESMNYDAIHMISFIVMLLKNVPEIERDVHSKWVNSYRSGYKPPDVVVCNHCDYWNEKKEDYCPNCGAKMDLQTEK